jgi:hypothetical protein
MGSAVNDFFAPKQFLRENSSMNLHLVSIEIAERNHLTHVDGMFKQPEVLELQLARSDGTIPPGKPPEHVSALP